MMSFMSTRAHSFQSCYRRDGALSGTFGGHLKRKVTMCFQRIVPLSWQKPIKKHSIHVRAGARVRPVKNSGTWGHTPLYLYKYIYKSKGCMNKKLSPKCPACAPLGGNKILQLYSEHHFVSKNDRITELLKEMGALQ